jgi:ribose transport system substrate-binding protein
MKWNRLGCWALGMAIGGSLAGGALAESTASKRIAFSNSYAGNSFRQAMLESWEHVAARAIAAGKIKAAPVFTTADNSATEQAAQIQDLVLQGFDAIVVNAASPTALNGAIKKACQAGVVVVSFDGVVTEPCAYRVTHNYREFGVEEMRYIGEALPNGGNVLELRGIAGTFIDNEVSEGVHDTLKSMPKFKLVSSVYGNWNPVDSQKAVAGVLPSLSKVDAVLNSAGGTGVIRAFEIAGRPLPVMTLGNQYDELSWWQQRKRNTGFDTRSAGANPGIASFAFWVAQQALEGRKMPKDIDVPFLVVAPEALDSTLAGMKPGGNVTQDYTLDNVSDALR